MDGCRHRLFGSHRKCAAFAFPFVVLLVLLLPGWAFAADYTVSNLSGQTFTSLEAAEAALHASSIRTNAGVNVPGSDYQRTGSTSSSSNATVYIYTVPNRPVTVWYYAGNNNGPGPYGGYLDPRDSCASCLSGYRYPPLVGLTNLTPSNPYPWYRCEFTNTNYSLYNSNACWAIASVACSSPGFIATYDPTDYSKRICLSLAPAVTITERLGACPIRPLPPFPLFPDTDLQSFEDNPDRSDTTRLSDRMRTALSCLQTAISDAGGTSSVGSGYRPPAYNQHLIDVWEKWVNELKEETNPACQALRRDVQNHFRRHRLLESQPPVPGSRHTTGEAFDLSSNLPPANLDTLAQGCQVYRNDSARDRVHFIHR